MAGIFLLIIALGMGFIQLTNDTMRRQENASLPFSDSNQNTSTTNFDCRNGKLLFQQKCASCHNVFKDGTGPALGGIPDNEKWADRNELLKWINNPAAYMKNDPYTQNLKARYGAMMTAFPFLVLEDIEAILCYIEGVGHRTVY